MRLTAIRDTERYNAAISTDQLSSRHGRWWCLLQVHKMEIDEAETLELVGVLVYSSIAQIPVSGELSQFQLTLYCPGEDNTPTGP